jgi:hypothetical protein
MSLLNATTLLLCMVSLLFFMIVGILMFFAFSAIRYRRTKYQDQAVLYRWIFIPILFPLRVCYEIVRLVLRIARWLLFVIVGVVALILSPIYFFVVLPMTDYNNRLRQTLTSFDKFVELFRSEIRLGQWLMFYPTETINAEIEPPRRPQFGSTARPQRPPSPSPEPAGDEELAGESGSGEP